MEDDAIGKNAGSPELLPWVRDKRDRRAAAANLYKPLQRWQTRILRLHGGDKDAPLVADLLPAGLGHDQGLILSMDREIESYEAISYAWGADLPSIVILVNRLEMLLNVSLAGALHAFRKEDTSRCLWADAICINQYDEQEKSTQVLSMFNIYRKAAGVLVWLGDTIKEMPGLVSALQDGADFDDMDVSHRRALKSFAEKPWHRRLWVRQEVFAARSVTFRIGDYDFHIKTFQQMWRLAKHETKVMAGAESQRSGYRVQKDHVEAAFLEAAEDVLLCDLGKFSRLEAARHSVASQIQAGKARDVEGEDDFSPNECSLEAVLYKHAALEASNDHDRIFAVLGMTDAPQRTVATGKIQLHATTPEWSTVVVDYSMTYSQAFEQITRFILNRDRTLGLLAMRRDGGKLRFRDKLPSWVLKWTIHNRVRPFPNPRPLKALELQKHPLDGTLRLRGIVLATLVPAERHSESDYGPKPASVHVRSNISHVFCASTGSHTRDVRVLTYQSQVEEHSCQDSALKEYNGLTMAVVDGLEGKQCIWLRPMSTDRSSSDRFAFDRFEFVSIELIDQTAQHVFKSAVWDEVQDNSDHHSSPSRTKDVIVESQCLEKATQDLVIC